MTDVAALCLSSAQQSCAGSCLGSPAPCSDRALPGCTRSSHLRPESPWATASAARVKQHGLPSWPEPAVSNEKEQRACRQPQYLRTRWKPRHGSWGLSVMDTMAALGTQGSCQARTGAPSPGTQAGLGGLGAPGGPTLSGISKLMALWHLPRAPRRRSHLPLPRLSPGFMEMSYSLLQIEHLS